MTSTSNPSPLKSIGATVVVAPLAQSTASRKPAKGGVSPTICRRCSRYAPTRSSCGTCAGSPGCAVQDGSARMASTSRSTRSVNFSPRPENTLMPLSPYGLCDAEMTTPASNACVRVRYATAGVGTTPALVTTAPSPDAPCASSASIHVPDSRVSRPTRKRSAGRAAGGCGPAASARTSAAPSRRTVGGSSGYCPATPRTPSVPNNFGIVSLLATADAHLHGCGIDLRDAGILAGIDVHVERVLPGAETADVDVRGDFVGRNPSEPLAAAAQRDVDRRRLRLRDQRRSDVSQVHRPIVDHALGRRRFHLRGDHRGLRILDPEGRVEDADRHRLAHAAGR